MQPHARAAGYHSLQALRLGGAADPAVDHTTHPTGHVADTLNIFSSVEAGRKDECRCKPRLNSYCMYTSATRNIRCLLPATHA
jgi:hypothetical protein